MKNRKIIVIVTCLFAVLCLSGCGNEAEKYIIKGYNQSDEYFDDGFQDYTDYCKYYYDSYYDEEYAKDDNYTEITADNIDTVKNYFISFPYENMSNSDAYDFDVSIVTEGDYYCIIDESDYSNNREDYDVYLYDKESHILYYIHNNY